MTVRSLEMYAMKAMRLRKPRELVMENIEIPKITKEGVLIKVEACGVCRTDVNYYSGMLDPRNWGRDYPITLGHEVAGKIAEVGGDVSEVKVGDHVILKQVLTCGRCTYCVTGRDQLCTNKLLVGRSIDGGFAEYIHVPISLSNVVKINESVPFEQAAPLGCAGLTVIHGLRRGRLVAGDTVVIYGAGGLGTTAIQVAKLMGATVIVIDVRPNMLKISQELGADYTINAKEVNPAEEVRRLTEGYGADVVMELVTTDETLSMAVSMLARNGRLIVIGTKPSTIRAGNMDMLVYEKEILGSGGGTFKDLQDAAKWIAQGKIKPLIARVVKLDETPGILEAQERDEVLGRAVVKP